MNLPNKLTLLRIILIPVFMVVLYWGFPGATWVALAIFIIASLTDMLDCVWPPWGRLPHSGGNHKGNIWWQNPSGVS